MFEAVFRLPSSLGEWVTFPQHQISAPGTIPFVPKNPLKLHTPLHHPPKLEVVADPLVCKLIGPREPFKVRYIEDGSNLLTGWKTQPVLPLEGRLSPL